ncbi:MAG TPA: pyridoxamine 5'-phosphate oxidase family protein [Ktedonobacterales bacterium]|nr:pyridoxamine 5'-phosphate oxidase family protein [Ktedonobacterales bacterium]
MATRQGATLAEAGAGDVIAERESLAARGGTSPRSRIRRHAERAAPAEAERILRAGRVAHVAYTLEGQPYVIPFSYDYADGAIYLHGAPASRTLKSLRGGMDVAIEVTLLDGLIASRDAESHSMNYRAVVVFSRAERVTTMAEKRAIMERMTLRYFPGRTVGKDYEAATEKQMRALEVLRVPVTEFSAKMRGGGPRGPRDADPTASGTAYVVEMGGREA